MIIYYGPSALSQDRARAIMAVLTTGSRNPKTGPMDQLWILPAESSVVDALRHDGAASVCGDCPLRGVGTGVGRRRCYVIPLAPHGVWKAVLSGRYQDWRHDVAGAGAGRVIRLGAWGDPAALPLTVIGALLSRAAGWTGYTHAWRACDPDWRRYLNASVETVHDAEQAQALGWRTFRVRQPDDDQPLATEIICPASAEAGRRTTCARCRLCDGTRETRGSDRRKSIVILEH